MTKIQRVDEMGKSSVARRRPHRQAQVNLRVSREQRDALRRVAERRGMTVTDYIVAKIAPDLRREMRALESK